MNFMNENENKNIRSQVLEKITSGKINMTPRFYFVLKIVALVVVVLLTLMVSSLLISFIIFSLMASGRLVLLGFGARGFLNFFLLFPWLLLVVEILLLIALERLLKHFRLGYRSSFSTLIAVILCMSLVISVVINSTSFHRMLQDRAEKSGLPLVGDYYRGLRRSQPNEEIFRGVVSDVSTSSFVLNPQLDSDDAVIPKYIVFLPAGSASSSLPLAGDTVFVAGQLRAGNTIQAYGLQKLSNSSVSY